MIFDGNQDKETIIINESGLYSLILSSKMPNAKKFKHWVTAEVLPDIRKHGMYAIDEILENPDLAIAALTQLKEERERRKQLECLALVQRQQRCSQKQATMTLFYRTRTQFLLHRLQRTMV